MKYKVTYIDLMTGKRRVKFVSELRNLTMGCMPFEDVLSIDEYKETKSDTGAESS